MTASLENAVVAQFESRRRVELESLIRRHGGEPWTAPALSEVTVDVGVAERAAIDRLAAGNFDLVVLLTGVGTQRLLEESARAGHGAAAKTALERAVTIARGPKPVFELRRHGLKPTHVVPEPNTTAQLLATLESIPVRGSRVLIVSAGEPFDEPAATLRARGAFPVDLQLYRWELTPNDAAGLERTIAELIAGRIDAALFTTQVQVRHLFDVAARVDRTQELIAALRDRTIVGAVGPTCAAALRDRGVDPHIVPEHPKMGHLVVALADRLAPIPPSESPIADYVGAVLAGTGALP